MSMSDLPIPNRHPTLRKYLKDVVAWHGYVRFLGMPTLQNTPDVPLDDLYVGQSISRQYLSAENEPFQHDLLSPVQMLLEHRCMVVLGDPGSGKSTLINWFAWYLASGFEIRLPNALAHALPVPIILRELALSNVTNFSDLLDAALQRPVAEHLDRRTLYEYINYGSVIFLIDGLDELSFESKNIVKSALTEGMKNLSQSFFLITSRIVGYDHIEQTYLKIDSEYNKYSVHSESSVNDYMSENILNTKIFVSHEHKNVSTFYIAPFSDSQISQFSFNWYREQMDGIDTSAKLLRDQFISSIFSDENTRRLSRTPHLLTMMALIFRKRAHLPNGRAILYDAISQAYLESIDQARGLKDEYDWQSKKLWLAKVAFEMQLQRSSNSDSEELLFDKHIVLDWIKSAISGFQYQVNDQYAEDFLNWIARRSGLLLPRGQDQYAFLHLSFQEYFAAVYVQSQLENPSWIDKEDEQTLDQRVSTVALAQWANEINWNQTLIFIFELMSKKPGWSKRIWRYFFASDLYTFEVSNWHDNMFAGPRPAIVDLKWTLLSNRHCYVDNNLQLDEFNEIFSLSAKEQDEANGICELYGMESLQNIILSSDKEYIEYVNFITKNFHGKSFNVSDVDLSAKTKIFKFFKNKKITEISLKNCNLDSVEFIHYLQNLIRIDVNSNKIENIPNCNIYQHLKYVNLSFNRISSIDFLEFSNELISLDIRNNIITSLSALRNIKTLKALLVDTIKESDSLIIKKMRHLVFLGADVRSQSVIENIFDCSNLSRLNISGSDISSIENIGKLKRLKFLHIENLALDNWNPILEIPELKHLSFNKNSKIDNRTLDKIEKRNIKIHEYR